ncbi:hypothetical protein MMC14_010499 [Varicellaria rhodocarpa]|nr:hypothetical protein [Varicellaria rhodocarpa]
MTLLSQQKNYTVRLSRAQLADVPALVQITEDAFAPDLFNKLVTASDPERDRSHFEKNLIELFEMPNVAIIKAEIVSTAENETTESGQIVAWSAWAWNVTDKDSTRARVDDGHWRSLAPSMSPVLFGKEAPAAGSLLDVFMEEEKKFERRWFANRDQMVLGLLNVAPKYQGRGIGEKLLEWGVKVADQRRLVCRLGATPVAWKIYQQFGWHVVDVQKIDLSEWFSSQGTERRENDETAQEMGYGCYLLRRMIRLPEGKSE